MTLLGCGGGTTSTEGGNPTPQGKLVDPSGNWKQSFTDSNGNTFILSALYNQVGSVVTGINFSEVGNVAPGFQCVAQRDISISNGQVALLAWARQGRVKGHVLSGIERQTWRFRQSDLDACLKEF